MEQTTMPIGAEQLREFTRILQKYSAGLQPTKNRIIASENWWKLRNGVEEGKTTELGRDGGFQSRSGWLHNVIVSKHADAMEAYPQPVILPREASDRAEAQKLSAIIPCVLEQNGFESTYSDAMWQKCKTGTAAYKILWDSSRLGGLGDIRIQRVNLLNLCWEPGVEDIQKSRYFFHTELMDRELLEQRYPEQKALFKGQSFLQGKFLYDDRVDTENKLTVVEVYYHKYPQGRKTLHYCRYCGDAVLFATENDPLLESRGLYDHGLYPYEFDPLYPIEGSPCGYGYVDVCRNPQTEIDLMKTSFVKSSQVGATPRYFARQDGAVNEAEFLDLSKPIVHVNGNLGQDSVRPIDFRPLNDVYVGILDRTIQELRQTSGNTETSTGNISAGVTAASAIAALQEASGKGSRDAARASYRSFQRIVNMCIELIRQFYTLPRQFRILGPCGMEQYISYTNRDLQPVPQEADFGCRLPVFDIKITAQKKNLYTTVSQNELALQLFKLGFFEPGRTEQARMCLDLMDFEGKDQLLQKLARYGDLREKLQQYMALALELARRGAPEMVEGLSRDVAATAAGSAPGGALPGLSQTEPAPVRDARVHARSAAVPEVRG